MSKDKKAIIEVQGATITSLFCDGLAQGEQLQKLNAIDIRKLGSLSCHVAPRALGVPSIESKA